VSFIRQYFSLDALAPTAILASTTSQPPPRAAALTSGCKAMRHRKGREGREGEERKKARKLLTTSSFTVPATQWRCHCVFYSAVFQPGRTGSNGHSGIHHASAPTQSGGTDMWL
jgi:hypothetical protein